MNNSMNVQCWSLRRGIKGMIDILIFCTSIYIIVNLCTLPLVERKCSRFSEFLKQIFHISCPDLRFNFNLTNHLVMFFIIFENDSNNVN